MTIQDLEIIIPEKRENDILSRLDNSYLKISEMSNDDRSFLTALILRNRPKKLVEVGVSRGGSSIVILNAIKELANSHLYSIDYSEQWYETNDVKTGDFVDNYPELKSNWTLFTGGLALKFMEQIGTGVDFCLLDTTHYNPGEILDFLMVLPFLTDEAILVFHDIKIHTMCYKKTEVHREIATTTSLLMSSVYGKKIGSSGLTFADHSFPNIGAIQINSDTRKHLFEVFNLLTMKWIYIPTINEQEQMIDFFKKYYEKIFIEYLKDVFLHHNKYFKIKTQEQQVEKKSVNHWIKAIGKKLLGEK